MTNLRALIDLNRNKILDLATKYGAANVRIFGSVARGEDTDGSDVDFLVDFKTGTSLVEWCSLRLDLKDLLGCDVDIATEKTLKPRLKSRVLNEAQSI
jgi:predicted nucleotidyltransferase